MRSWKLSKSLEKIFIISFTPLVPASATTSCLQKKWINILHLYNAHIVQTLQDIRFALQSEVSAVSTLVRGFLPIELIPPSLLQGTLDLLTDELQGTPFRIVHPDAATYYHIRDILYQRDSDHLCITLKIPVSTIRTEFTAFRIRAFPIILDGDPVSYSSVSLSPFFGISKDNRYFILLSIATNL